VMPVRVLISAIVVRAFTRGTGQPPKLPGHNQPGLIC
jgi:hypothetical protein